MYKIRTKSYGYYLTGCRIAKKVNFSEFSISNVSSTSANQNNQGNDLMSFTSSTLPSKSRIVICGGGLMSATVAYHLGLYGLGPETLIVEQGR